MPPPPPPACPARRREQVDAVQAGWQAVQQDPQLRSSFLTTPIHKLKGFTAKQKE